MAKATRYMLNQRKPLRRFLENGLVPLDSNRCERSIRPIAVGRKSWLFAGSLRGGRAAATIYTLIECCRLAEVDSERYLTDVLLRVASHPASRIDELLPSRWKQLVEQGQADIAPVTITCTSRMVDPSHRPSLTVNSCQGSVPSTRARALLGGSPGIRP